MGLKTLYKLPTKKTYLNELYNYKINKEKIKKNSSNNFHKSRTLYYITAIL